MTPVNAYSPSIYGVSWSIFHDPVGYQQPRQNTKGRGRGISTTTHQDMRGEYALARVIDDLILHIFPPLFLDVLKSLQYFASSGTRRSGSVLAGQNSNPVARKAQQE